MHPSLTVILAVVLLVMWITFLYEGRAEMRRRERLTDDFLFKWNVLPLLLVVELLTMRSPFVLGVGVMIFFLSWPVARWALTALPALTGLHVGAEWFSHIFVQPDPRVLVGAVIVAIALTLVSQVIVVAMSRPPAHT